MEAVQTPPLRAMQRVNEWGNTHSGFLAVAGVVLGALLFARRR